MANRQNSAHDWLSIEKRFVEGQESLRKLAKALRISASTLMKQSADRKWGAKRRRYRETQREQQAGPDVPIEAAIRRSRLIARVAELRAAILDDLLIRAAG